jgi:ribokinase
MDILNFGSLNFDHYYYVDHMVRAGETLAPARTETIIGGKGLNQSIAAARAGATVFHAGCVGPDGKPLLAYLQADGVDTRHIRTVEERSGHTVIQLDKNGQNSILLYGGANLCQTTEQIDHVLAAFAPGMPLLLQNEINHLAYLAGHAADRGFRVCLNPSPANAALEGVDYGKLYLLILNELEGEQLTGQHGPAAMLTTFREKWPSLKVLLTLGGDGALYLEDGHSYSQPIFPVPVADTTGAGDTFTGYFLCEHLRGASPAQSLRMAAAAAAVAVSGIGAAPSIPRREKVVEFLAVHSA